MKIEEIKEQLKEGVFALKQENNQPANMYCFATFQYIDGVLIINGESKGIMVEEQSNDKLIISTDCRRFTISPNKIIYSDNEDYELEGEYVFGDNRNFINVKTQLDNLLPKTDKLASINASSELVKAYWGYHGVEINRTKVLFGYISQVNLDSKLILYTNEYFSIQDGVNYAIIRI